MVTNRKWILLGALAFLLVFSLISSAAAESDNLKVTVVCPNQVPVGGRVVIALQILNEGYMPVQISNSAAVAGYPGAQILGPYTLPLSRTIDPWQTVTIPDYAAYNISQEIPAGTLIGHGVCLFGSDFNNPYGCGGAITEVVAQ